MQTPPDRHHKSVHRIGFHIPFRMDGSYVVCCLVEIFHRIEGREGFLEGCRIFTKEVVDEKNTVV